MQAVGHFFGDVSRYFYILIALQITTRHIQRNIRRIDDTMQQCQKVGHNAFDRIGYKHLIAIELDFVALQVDVVFDAREVQNAGQIERIIDIQMNVEQRLFAIRIEFAIELA